MRPASMPVDQEWTLRSKDLRLPLREQNVRLRAFKDRFHPLRSQERFRWDWLCERNSFRRKRSPPRKGLIRCQVGFVEFRLINCSPAEPVHLLNVLIVVTGIVDEEDWPGIPLRGDGALPEDSILGINPSTPERPKRIACLDFLDLEAFPHLAVSGKITDRLPNAGSKFGVSGPAHRLLELARQQYGEIKGRRRCSISRFRFDQA